jgi:hypothetical protein
LYFTVVVRAVGDNKQHSFLAKALF